MPVINNPPLRQSLAGKPSAREVLTGVKEPSPTSSTPTAWAEWFNQVYTVCFALQQSGVTAKRPTTNLWTGRPYFDTTLGKPIWYKTAGWVDATGASV